MTLATLAEVLQPALEGRYAVAGVVALGWEDMQAYVTAAELEGLPIVLQAGPACRAHTPLPVLGKMFRHLAETTLVPVVAHLDHGYSLDECRQALDCGFTSLMYDGSRKPLAANIAETRKVVELAHGAGISCEGEIGFVGYAAGARSLGTNPEEASVFEKETGVDAMAISVGNVHLQEQESTRIDEDLVRAIEAVTKVPLVIHGGSGVPGRQRMALAASSRICKFNIGTELRRTFGHALREAVNKDPRRFDRIEILNEATSPLVSVTRSIIRGLKPVV